MRAVRWHGRGDVRLDHIPDAPMPGPGQVRLRVDWCGICGTDREEWRAGPLFIPTLEPHPMTGTAAPLTLGHEVSGTVTDVSEDVSGLAPGDIVALDGILTCGTCWWCKRHELTLCPLLASIGLHVDGGLAEAITVPARMAIVVPSGLDAETAALAEPVSVAIRALRKGRLAPGEQVLVQGAGMIGLSAMRVAKRLGATSVTVAARSERGRQRALDMGADSVVDPSSSGFLDEVRAFHDGRGPDLVVEAAGTPHACAQAVSASRRGGRVVFLGLPSEAGQLDYFELVSTERELIGSLSHVWDEDLAEAVSMLATGLLRADEVVAARIPLEDTVEVGFESMTSQQLAGVKILVSPWI